MTDGDGAGFDVGDDPVDFVQAGREGVGELIAFPLAIGHEIRERFLEKIRHRCGQCIVVEVCIVADDARPAQQVHRVRGADLRGITAQLLDHRKHLDQQRSG